MHRSDLKPIEAPRNKAASVKRRYWPPAFKKLGLTDVLKLLESNPTGPDQAVREQIEEFRLVLEQRRSR